MVCQIKQRFSACFQKVGKLVRVIKEGELRVKRLEVQNHFGGFVTAEFSGKRHIARFKCDRIIFDDHPSASLLVIKQRFSRHSMTAKLRS